MGFRGLFTIPQMPQNQKQRSISHFTSVAKPKTEVYFPFYKCRKIKNRGLFLILQVPRSQKQRSISHFTSVAKPKTEVYFSFRTFLEETPLTQRAPRGVLLLPETGQQDRQHGKDLQTARHHQKREIPFGEIRQL